jgi:hypothetical protein
VNSRLNVGIAALVIISFCTTAAKLSAAQDFCAMEVSVTFQDGSPVPSADVRLIDTRGGLVEQKEVIAGKVEFCDFGFGRHSILINGDKCGGVMIKNVRVVYGTLQKFKAVLNTCAGDGDVVSAHGCLVFIRAKSDSGQPLDGVTISSKSVTRTTDSYGRVLTGVRSGEVDTFMVSKPGYQRTSLRVDCTTQVYEPIERTIVLKTQ